MQNITKFFILCPSTKRFIKLGVLLLLARLTYKEAMCHFKALAFKRGFNTKVVGDNAFCVTNNFHKVFLTG